MNVLRMAGTALIVSFATGVHAAPARVKVEYDPGQDRCDSLKDEWKRELASRQAEFLRIWESEGPKLVAAAQAITGKAFPAQEIGARLTLCNSPSESFPAADRVVINMRFALASFTRAPVSMRYKVHTMFHELLHLFLFRHPVRASALLDAHAAEPERVRGHLHLLALQKAILVKLGEDEVLKEIIAVDSALPGGYYKRAWEIVNATEGEHLRYVAELSR
ncbi:MAG TPA: hypothetical protein VM051_11820 [Usitatibacter sp.]|nr:hypothetical protein [Usitatibacter sp.]